MENKKDFLHRKIKQEAESEPYNSTLETFNEASNLLQVKFEDTSCSNDKAEDQTDIDVDDSIAISHAEHSSHLKKCIDIPSAEPVKEHLETPKPICRLCALPITGNAVSIYEHNGLDQKINYAFPITTSADDGLPEHICQGCVINTHLFYDFVCQVIVADKALRDRLNPPDVKTNTKISDVFIDSAELVQSEKPSERHKCDQFLHLPNSEHLYNLKNSLIKDFSKNQLQQQFLSDKKPSKRLFQEDELEKLHKSNRTVPAQLEPQIKCQHCGQFFDCSRTLITHNKLYHDTKLACPEEGCTQIFATAKMLRQHITDAHDVPVICYQCGKIFAHPAALQKHRQNRHMPKMCGSCGMTFHTDLALMTHQQLHQEVGEHQCVYCFKNFKSRYILLRHTRQCHSGCFSMLVDGDEGKG